MNLHTIAPPPAVDIPGTRVQLYANWDTPLAGATGTTVGWVHQYRTELIQVQLDGDLGTVYAELHELELIQ